MFITEKMMVSLGRFVNKMDKKEQNFLQKHPSLAKKINPFLSFLAGSLFCIIFIFLVFILPQLIELIIFGEITPYE